MTETKYPHEDGDFTVIGPECFAGEDDNGRKVISWKGENFVSQGEDQTIEELIQAQARTLSAKIREIAYLSAGAGSGAVMQLAPEVVMPTEDIMERVDFILKEAGVA